MGRVDQLSQVCIRLLRWCQAESEFCSSVMISWTLIIFLCYQLTKQSNHSEDQCPYNTQTTVWICKDILLVTVTFTVSQFSWRSFSLLSHIWGVVTVGVLPAIFVNTGSYLVFDWIASHSPQMRSNCTEEQLSDTSKFFWIYFFLWLLSLASFAVPLFAFYEHRKRLPYFDRPCWFDRKKRAALLQKLIRCAGTKEGCRYFASEYCDNLLQGMSLFEDWLVRNQVRGCGLIRIAKGTSEPMFCAVCDQRLLKGELAVDLRRQTFGNEVWHNDCFKSLTASQLKVRLLGTNMGYDAQQKFLEGLMPAFKQPTTDTHISRS